MKTKDSQKSSSSEEEDGMQSEQELMQTSENLQKVAQEKEASKSLGWRWKGRRSSVAFVDSLYCVQYDLLLDNTFLPWKGKRANVTVSFSA